MAAAGTPGSIRTAAIGARAGTLATRGARSDPMTSVAEVFPPCPACGSRKVINIIYGLPGRELMDAELRAEVVLGGCIVGPESPEFECRACHAVLPWVAMSD